MTFTRVGPCLLVLALLIGACASDEPQVSGGVEIDLGEAKGGPENNGDEDHKNEDGGSGRPSGSNKPNNSGTGTGQGSASEDGGGEDDASSAFAPAPGTYVYSQTGFEEFCDASSCDRKDLPPTQEVATTHKERSSRAIVVVTEAESSDRRFTRTTTRYTREHALVTNVQIRFNYQGFNFNNSYEPEPPVESVRYPLREGSSWSGAWEDSTSGTYSIAVGAPRSVTVGNATVQAWPVRSRTTFTGEFEGRADVVTWIDPATAAVVKIAGEIDVESVFGGYRSEFSATLRSGSGY